MEADLKGSPHGFCERQVHWLRDPAAGTMNASEAMADLLGLPRGEDWRRYVDGFGLVHPDDRDHYRQLVETALRAARGWRMVFRIIRPCDNRLAWLDEAAEPVCDPLTGRTLIAGVVSDVTALRQGGVNDSRLAAIVESSDDAVISKNLDGIIQTWNAGAERMFGYTSEEAIGKPVTILMPPDRIDEEPGILARIRTGERIDHYETVRQRKDGTRLDISLSVSPIRNELGQIVGASKIARDITERKRTERRNASLAELADDLIQFKDTAETMQRISQRIARHFGVAHCVFSQFGNGFDIGGSSYDWSAEGVLALTDRDRWPDLLPEFEPTERSGGRIDAVTDTRADPRIAGKSFEANGIRSFLSVPLVRDGARRFTVSLLDDKPRVWRADEIDLLVDISQRIWTRAAQAHAEDLLRRTYRTFFALIENLPFGIYVVDSDFRIAVASQSAHRTFAVDGQLIGRDVGEALREIWNPRFAEEAIANFRHTLETGERFHSNSVEARINRSGTEAYDWRLERIEMPDGRPGVVCYYYEYTDRLAFEAQLRESEARLRRADQAKDEFLAMLGHELRNPLSPITTTLELMALRAPGTFTAERSVIEKQVRYLTELVDDLLDVSRIARGKLDLKLEPVAIDEVIAMASETTEPLFEQREQALQARVEHGLFVNGNQRRLVQVLVNLLTNAAKYSPRGCSVELAVAAQGEEIVMQVQDQGQGIDPARLEEVFDAFMQESQAMDRSRGGLGLGLAIVRNVVQLHGGTVTAMSEGRNRGSQFTVRLPLLEKRHAGTVAEIAAPAVATDDKRATRVLVVDDYPAAAESLSMLLGAMGYETRIVHDGPAALAAIVDFMPSVVLLDIGLPTMNGYEVARAVRATSGFADLPLVAITGYGQPADHARVMEAGFNEHLVKPLKAAKIGALIESLVGA